MKALKAMKAMKIKTIIFDVGGVIADDIEEPMMLDIANKYGLYYPFVMRIRWRYWRLLSTGKITERDYWSGFLRDSGIDEPVSKFIGLPYKYARKVKGTLGTIKRLKAMGPYRLLILSDHSREWSGYIVKESRLKGLFDKMIFSYAVGVCKPTRKMFQHALSNARARPSEILYIDNDPRNTGAAKRLGINTILFKGAAQLEKRLIEIGIMT